MNGFHLKRCPDKLVDMDEPLQPPVPKSSDPGIEHPETSNPRSPSVSPHNDSKESIPPLPPPMPSPEFHLEGGGALGFPPSSP